MYEYEASLVRVIRADTIEADVDLGFGINKTIRCRIMGYDDPERHADDNAAKSLSQFVTRRLQSLLDCPFTLQTVRKDDQDQWLSKIYLPGMGDDISIMLLHDGLVKRHEH